jgi:acyl-CoA synthetase (NDP forming)
LLEPEEKKKPQKERPSEVGMKIIEQALKKGQKSLSEYDSKRVLKSYGFPVVKERLVDSRATAVKAAKEIGLPVVLKACSRPSPTRRKRN